MSFTIFLTRSSCRLVLLHRSHVGGIDETDLVARRVHVPGTGRGRVLRRPQNLNFFRSSSATRYRWLAKAAWPASSRPELYGVGRPICLPSVTISPLR